MKRHRPRKLRDRRGAKRGEGKSPYARYNKRPYAHHPDLIAWKKRIMVGDKAGADYHDAQWRRSLG